MPISKKGRNKISLPEVTTLTFNVYSPTHFSTRMYCYKNVVTAFFPLNNVNNITLVFHAFYHRSDCTLLELSLIFYASNYSIK